MAIENDNFAIEQVRRVLKAMGWTIIATDTAGNSIKITVERPKEQEKKEGA